ncbi:MAG: T9SS type A sorting domain-containing protein [candidate division Zixibacteria bacterium]|nr:T9SS type A sorting domain-containing protein [candidate division Zixibacteria bacterium]
MPKLSNKFLLIFIWLLWSAGTMAITTGDLLTAVKSAEDWPSMALERPELPDTYGTDNFLIHYTTEGEDAVFHPDVDINPRDGVPDYINRMSSFLEEAHHIYINVLGYDYPPSDEGFGGDERYDIYVTTITGLTVPEFRSEQYPERLAYAAYSYIGNDLRNEPHPDNPIPFLMATCAHEYFHAVQMAYRTYTEEDIAWWHELTAVWAEDRVFSGLNEHYYYIDDYYSKINRSIYQTGGAHVYGAWIFAEYLSQNYGVNIIRMIWEKLINFDNSMAAITTSLSELGLNLDEEFSIFSGWNYFTHHNYRPGFFVEGESYPVSVPIALSHYSYPTEVIETPQSIENLGIAYVYFGNPGVVKTNLIIDFRSDIQSPEGLCIAAIYNNKPIEISTYNVPPNQNITLTVEDFDDCDGVVLCVNWRYQSWTLSDSACYRYYAYLDTIIVGVTAGKDSAPAEFSLDGNYPNPFNLSSNIIFHWNLKPSDYNIRFYDLGGRLIERLDGVAQTGVNSVQWTPSNDIASGVYFYRLNIGDMVANRRMVLLK